MRIGSDRGGRVVDASALVAALATSTPDGKWAEETLIGDRLVAPHLLLAEASNLLRRFELIGLLTAFEATAARRRLVDLDVDLHPFAPFAERVWELRANLTAYDAWYVAVAEAFELPLVTLDRRLARAPGPACRFLVPPQP